MIDDMTPVLIIGIVFAFVSFNVYLKYRRDSLRHDLNAKDSELHREHALLQEKTEDLEQRVRVLESIVTNRKFQLQQEIDSLS